MRIVLAPDSFKGALLSAEALKPMAEGVRRVLGEDADIRCTPMSDGGEGFTLVMSTAIGAELVEFEHVSGPGVLSLQDVGGVWGWLEGDTDEPATAVIELAAASGLQWTRPEHRNPAMYSTAGTGQVLRAALDAGVKRILLGIGGSATIDGACGIAQVLGVRFTATDGTVYGEPDEHGDCGWPPMTGGTMESITRIDVSHLDPRLRDVDFRVFNDVSNPLLGPSGAVAVYGPQKGATGEIAERLERGLANLARLWKEQFGQDVAELPGAGAAGGVGGGLVAMLGAALVPGADTVMDELDFDEAVREANLVLTGEGRLDGQSLSGKAVLKVAQRAAKFGVPTVALVGSASDDAARCLGAGLHAYEVLAPHLPPDESIAQTAKLLADAAERVVRRFVAEYGAEDVN